MKILTRIFVTGGVVSSIGKGISAASIAAIKVPFLGICLGLQLAIVESARNVCGLKDANSTEFDEKTPYPVIDLMPAQRDVVDKGATMRLGAFDAELADGSLVAGLYGKLSISERHRHRYEVDNKLLPRLLEGGMMASGVYTGEWASGNDALPDGREGLVEVIEIPSHPFFLGSQFHPEYKSRPRSPHPIFAGFVTAALNLGKIRNKK